MQTIEDFINHGVGEKNAIKMFENYSRRIGTINGDYEIIDINYDFSTKGKVVTLKCTGCGKVIYRTLITRRNKWEELIKICEYCEVERRKQSLVKMESEKLEKILSEKGNIYGDYIVSEIEFENTNKIIMNCMKCGSEIKISYSSLINGTWKDTKCHKHYIQDIKYDESYIGNRYEFLEVIGISHEYGQKRKFICKCEVLPQIPVKIFTRYIKMGYNVSNYIWRESHYETIRK